VTPTTLTTGSKQSDFALALRCQCLPSQFELLCVR
jgi:hypothetical protein